MKRVGIITMHKALSYGSALQAYALQEIIYELGYEARIIDYKYPNKSHIKSNNKFHYYFGLFLSFCIHMFVGFPNVRKKMKFKGFYQKYYRLSVFYPTEQSIIDNPPLYDIYMTGSDQVWNPNFIRNDRTFLLSFLKDNATRVSYGASFAVSSVPEKYKESYRDYLSKYSFITVREQSGLKIVRDLTGKDAHLVCDPTLLITEDKWNVLTEESKIKIDKPYILVFILGYSFNPYPQVRNIVKKVKNKLKIKTIYLDGRKKDFFHLNSEIIKSAGPIEFLNLVKNATFVITDSFHGTVFSNVFSIPFISVVKTGNSDSRIVSFLHQIGKEDRAVPYDCNDFNIITNVTTTSNSNNYVNSSLAKLKKMLEL